MNFVIKYIAAYQVKKLCALPRNKEFVKLNDAKTIGILFDATNNDTFETVKKFIEQLKAYTKNVHAIGYVDEKITPNYSYIKTDIDLFNKKELKSFYQPQSSYIKTFMEDEKDLLIDINLNRKTPLQFIAASSKAKCKVGIHLPENEPLHDILIATNPQQGLDFYLQQVVKYLETV
ncbi:MAG TPA: hypothetical protein VK835_13765 [Bacteroidia bacterium]|jgi:hypothetical protein|nr:hypothetical protein [Bacteroidia bacterium]